MYLITEDEAIAPENRLLGRIPNNQLSIAVSSNIKIIDVAILPRTSPIEAEGFLSETPNLTHRIWSGGGMEDIDLVAPLIRQT